MSERKGKRRRRKRKEGLLIKCLDKQSPWRGKRASLSLIQDCLRRMHWKNIDRDSKLTLFSVSFPATRVLSDVSRSVVCLAVWGCSVFLCHLLGQLCSWRERERVSWKRSSIIDRECSCSLCFSLAVCLSSCVRSIFLHVLPPEENRCLCTSFLLINTQAQDSLVSGLLEVPDCLSFCVGWDFILVSSPLHLLSFSYTCDVSFFNTSCVSCSLILVLSLSQNKLLAASSSFSFVFLRSSLSIPSIHLLRLCWWCQVFLSHVSSCDDSFFSRLQIRKTLTV